MPWLPSRPHVHFQKTDTTCPAFVAVLTRVRQLGVHLGNIPAAPGKDRAQHYTKALLLLPPTEPSEPSAQQSLCLHFHLFDLRDKETDGERSICWFTPRCAHNGRSQEPRTPRGGPRRWQGPKCSSHLGYPKGHSSRRLEAQQKLKPKHSNTYSNRWLNLPQKASYFYFFSSS